MSLHPTLLLGAKAPPACLPTAQHPLGTRVRLLSVGPQEASFRLRAPIQNLCSRPNQDLFPHLNPFSPLTPQVLPSALCPPVGLLATPPQVLPLRCGPGWLGRAKRLFWGGVPTL